MDHRLKMSEIGQRIFFDEIRSVSELNWDELGRICGVSGRTMRDWARAKFTPSLESCKTLSARFKVDIPVDSEKVDPYWHISEAAKKGGAARCKLHGPPGNIETRRQAGIISQQRRKADLDKYRALGCIVEKATDPLSFSVELAEMIGILLGDGGITSYQIKVTLSSIVDAEYARFVSDLMEGIFKERPSRIERGNVIILILSGIGFVKEIKRFGIPSGNKVKNQVEIPEWILKDKEYSKACLRGLVDTDGCVYLHEHVVKNRKYVNLGLTFSNHSRPLVYGVAEILKKFDFSPSIVNDKSVYIYSASEVIRYLNAVKSSNPKHNSKLIQYLKLKEK